MALCVYIIALSIVIGVLATITTFFESNLNVVRSTAKYAAEFDKFNAHMVADVKNNSKVSVDSTVDSTTIIFEDGTTYTYNQDDEGIYRGQTKVASHVTQFECSKKTITINNVDKEIVTINITIGDDKRNLFNKQIDYTLKYW